MAAFKIITAEIECGHYSEIYATLKQNSVLKPWAKRPTSRWLAIMDIRQLFAANLRRIRHEKGLSQEELAYEADVDRAHVSKIERELTYVGLEIIEKFAEVLGVPPDAFLQPIGRKRKIAK